MCAVGCAVAGCSPSGTPAPAIDVGLAPATKYIAAAFEHYPLVALSEMHGNLESQALFTSLIRDPEFQARVSDVVVEFGNGLYHLNYAQKSTLVQSRDGIRMRRRFTPIH